MRSWVLPSIGVGIGVVLTVPYPSVVSNAASYVPDWVPTWLASENGAHVVVWLGYVLVAASVGMVGGQYAAKKQIRATTSARRLTHSQKKQIADAFRHLEVKKKSIYIIPFGNDECSDFADDLIIAFRMAGLEPSTPLALGGISASARDIAIHPSRDGLSNAETLGSLLSDFGFKARVSPPNSDDGQLFGVVVNRPS